VFQLSPTQINHGVAFIGFLGDLLAGGAWTPPGRDLVLVETDVVGGDVVDQRLLERIDRSGWRVRDVIKVAVTDADWSPVIAAASGGNVAATLVAHYVPDEVARLVRTFAAARLDSLLYNVWTPSVPGFAELAGPAAEGLLWGTTTGVYGDALGRGFIDRYDRRFGRTPGRALAGTAYDQVHLLARAWAGAGGSPVFADVVAELRQTVHRGVNGSYFFGHDRQCGLSFPYETPDASLGQAHLVFQVQDGEHRIVHPALYAEADFRPTTLESPARGSRPPSSDGGAKTQQPPTVTSPTRDRRVDDRARAVGAKRPHG
jgi:branched-chain amino acid transport system substrate-binding protein